MGYEQDRRESSDFEATWVPGLIPELVNGHSFRGSEGNVFWLKARPIC